MNLKKANATLGTRISDLLKQQGLSQRELADKIGITEVSMSRYIKGERTPKGPIIADIAKVLHTTSDFLLGNETEESDPEFEIKRNEMHKADLTVEERELAEIIAVNYIIAQSDGFQLGYAQAISDFIQSIHDYWTTGDDQPQLSVLDTIAELGENLANRKRIAKENVEKATEKGYTPDIQWSPIGGNPMIWLYIKHSAEEAGGEESEDV